MRRFPVLIATGLCVLAVGCGDDDDDDDAPASAPPAATQTAAPGGGGGAAAGGTEAIERAVESAEGEVSGSEAYEVDTDTVGGQQVLQVKVAADGESTEVTTSADGRDVRDSRVDRDDADDARDAADAKVSLVDAIDAALDRAEGRTLESVELDRDNGGTLAYNVSFQGQTDDDEREVVVDAASGDVLQTTNDD